LIKLRIEYFQKFKNILKEALERSSPLLQVLSPRFSEAKAFVGLDQSIQR
jgi:hypothetical protein